MADSHCFKVTDDTGATVGPGIVLVDDYSVFFAKPDGHPDHESPKDFHTREKPDTPNSEAKTDMLRLKHYGQHYRRSLEGVATYDPATKTFSHAATIKTPGDWGAADTG